LKLSILIPSLLEYDRSVPRYTLIKELHRQINQSKEPSEYEILTDYTPRGQITIGAKRNKLIQQAKGKYIAFIDDDDMIRGSYIQCLSQGMMHNVDLISFGREFYRNGVYESTTFFNKFFQKENEASLKEVKAMNFNPYGISHFCGFYHLSCVKREIAMQVKFIDANEREDYLWSEGIKPLIQSEHHIPLVLYTVQHNK